MTFHPIVTRDRVLVNGKTGSGKGNRVKAICAGEMKRETRIVAFDPHDEYSVKGHATDHVRLGPLRERCTADQLLSAPAKWLDRRDLALAVVPDMSNRKACGEDFIEVAELVRHTGNLLFVVEEIGYFGDKCADELEDVACQYRHAGVSCIFVSQCAVQITKTARRQMSQLYTGRQDDPADLRAIAEITKSADFARRVSELPAGELLHWHEGQTTPEK